MVSDVFVKRTAQEKKGWNITIILRIQCISSSFGSELYYNNEHISQNKFVS